MDGVRNRYSCDNGFDALADIQEYLGGNLSHSLKRSRSIQLTIPAGGPIDAYLMTIATLVLSR